MNIVPRLLSKQRSHYFTLNYSPDYRLFITQRVLNDESHPLNEIRRRLQSEREKTGLWWHVTVGPSTSNRRVVRSWLRRRLRNALVEELKERGVSEDGTVTKNKGGGSWQQNGVIQALLDNGQEVSLKGSLKLHVLPPAVSAKYMDLREATGKVADALLTGLEVELKAAQERPNQKRSPLHLQYGRMPPKR